jgi:hypothetical protein
MGVLTSSQITNVKMTVNGKYIRTEDFVQAVVLHDTVQHSRENPRKTHEKPQSQLRG